MFTNADQLAGRILRSTVLDLLVKAGVSRPKPIALPYPSLGTLFKGRDKFMAELCISLQRATAGPAAAIVVKVLHGLGGVGKTRLAVEYAWQHRDNFSALLFVLADSSDDLRRNLAALVGPMVLNLPEKDAKEEEARVAAAVRWLQQNPGWLLISTTSIRRRQQRQWNVFCLSYSGGKFLSPAVCQTGVVRSRD
jgi:hypothetical protein